MYAVFELYEYNILESHTRLSVPSASDWVLEHRASHLLLQPTQP